MLSFTKAANKLYTINEHDESIKTLNGIDLFLYLCVFCRLLVLVIIFNMCNFRNTQQTDKYLNKRKFTFWLYVLPQLFYPSYL